MKTIRWPAVLLILFVQSVSMVMPWSRVMAQEVIEIQEPKVDYSFGEIGWMDSLRLSLHNLNFEPNKIDYPEVSAKQIYISFLILIVAILSLLFGPGILNRKK